MSAPTSPGERRYVSPVQFTKAELRFIRSELDARYSQRPFAVRRFRAMEIVARIDAALAALSVPAVSDHEGR